VRERGRAVNIADELTTRKKGGIMLYTILVVLGILWLLGVSLHVGGSLIHLLLIVALVVFVIDRINGRRRTV
jgi:uncharacterized protein DUF5670